MRWKVLLGLLALMLAATLGCQKQCFIPECDYDHYRSDLGLAPNVECDPAISNVPNSSNMGAPAKVTDPEREVRPISLAEAIALALEGGTTGSIALNGTSTDLTVSTFSPRPFRAFEFSQENGIRILALEPAIVGTDIEASLSKFDARWISSAAWSVTDQPIGGNFLNSFNNGQASSVQSSMLKPLPTGGVAGITFRTTYTNLSAPPGGVINPAYRPFLQFQFDQPLLQGFGVEINQLRASHPGLTQSVPGVNPPAGLLPFFNTGGRVEGILVTRIRFDEQRAEFERQVHIMLTNVEVAYWNLYGAYLNLASREDALREAAVTLNRVRERGGEIGRPEEGALTRAQYEQYRGLRLEALNQVLESERQLRALVGLPVQDGYRLVPVDKPTLAPFKPDWNGALNEALALRPELILARNEIKVRQLDIINQKNQLLPDLRFTSSYDINGFGSHLSGGADDPLNAFGGPGVAPGTASPTSGIAGNKFNDWSVGLRMDVPLGYRDAHAAVRTARLRLAQACYVLKDQEERAMRYLAQNYQQLDANYEGMKAAWVQRKYALDNMNFRRQRIELGLETPVEFLLDAQRSVDDANRAYYLAIVNYNNAMARFEFARGTIMQHDNVYIAEGGLPQCAQKRAVEHERQRTRALVLSERENPSGARLNGEMSEQPEMPTLSPDSIPTILRGQEASTDEMPAPTQGTQPLGRNASTAFSPVAKLLRPTAAGAATRGSMPANTEVVVASTGRAGATGGVVAAAYRPAPAASVTNSPRPTTWKPVDSPLGKPVPAYPAQPAPFPTLHQPIVDLPGAPPALNSSR